MFYPKTTIAMVLLAGILGYRALPRPVAEAWILDPSARVLAHANRTVQHTRWAWLEYRAGSGDACALVMTGLQQLSPPPPDLFLGRFIARRVEQRPERARLADPVWLTGVDRSPAAGLKRIRRGLSRNHAHTGAAGATAADAPIDSAACSGVAIPDWVLAAAKGDVPLP